MEYAIIGGDERMACLARLLRRQGRIGPWETAGNGSFLFFMTFLLHSGTSSG